MPTNLLLKFAKKISNQIFNTVSALIQQLRLIFSLKDPLILRFFDFFPIKYQTDRLIIYFSSLSQISMIIIIHQFLVHYFWSLLWPFLLIFFCYHSKCFCCTAISKTKSLLDILHHYILLSKPKHTYKERYFMNIRKTF